MIVCAASMGGSGQAHQARVTAVVHELLPPGAIGVETYGDPPDAELFAEEAAYVARAADVRRREFASVRWCARLGLARLGLPRLPILPSDQGAPVWPAGVVGSMTHCAGYRAAAVARADVVRGLGIDAEPNEPLPPEVVGLVCSAAERARLQELAGRGSEVHCDRLLFCAKEAVYKVWYPLTRRWLGFEDADVTIDLDNGTFTARILRPGPVRTMPGRWTVHRGIIVAAIGLASESTIS